MTVLKSKKVLIILWLLAGIITGLGWYLGNNHQEKLNILGNLSVVQKNQSEVSAELTKKLLNKELQKKLDEIDLQLKKSLAQINQNEAEALTKLTVEARKELLKAVVVENTQTIVYEGKVKRSEIYQKSQAFLEHYKIMLPIKSFAFIITIVGSVVAVLGTSLVLWTRYAEMNRHFKTAEFNANMSLKNARADHINISLPSNDDGKKKLKS